MGFSRIHKDSRGRCRSVLVFSRDLSEAKTFSRNHKTSPETFLFFLVFSREFAGMGIGSKTFSIQDATACPSLKFGFANSRELPVR